MRRALALPFLLTAAVAPSASACTIDNCVEVRTATASWPGDDLHSLDARCAVTGRAGYGFHLVAEADARDAESSATFVTVRCVAYAGGVTVFDHTEGTDGAVATMAADFASRPDVRVCVEATAAYADGHTAVAGACE